MRIVIDMQGAQASNRLRGIGRYSLSLTQAIVRNAGDHEIILALNGLFSDSVETIKAAFLGLLPHDNIRVWEAPAPVDFLNSEKSRRTIAELMRESFVAHLEPDIVLMTSLFEGLGDDAVTSVGRLRRDIPVAAVLYDLIPLIHQGSYFANSDFQAWYLNKLDHLRRADLLLAISESSRLEAIRYLGATDGSAVNISTAAEPQFTPSHVAPERERELKGRYGIKRPFVMYTGGIDYRKNIEGLIRAFSRLAQPLRAQQQLAIVCSIQDRDRQRLAKIAQQHGLVADDMIMTGFVPEDDLIDLYRLCSVFVFPSLHEGFGLPALEAMSCGAAVIGANTSSVPEVIGRADALFDPSDEADIAAKLTRALTDASFRNALAQYGVERSKQFSWDVTAKRALAALQQHAVSQAKRPSPLAADARPKLAYVSPLPPERSGISDYSAELLPELARHYDIDVIVAQKDVRDPYITNVLGVRTVEWFRAHARRYDRILYHFGNSHFHQHMFDLLEEFPGVVMLHDFYLSAVISHMSHGAFPNKWEEDLYESHGYPAVAARFRASNIADVIWQYPCNLGVLRGADGIIVHSENSIRLARQWYANVKQSDFCVIPLLRAPAASPDRRSARRTLELSDESFVVCSFGLLGPHKLNDRLLKAWAASSLGKDDRCVLIFAGENRNDDYGREINKSIRALGLSKRVRITGWIERSAFRHYLEAADVGIQLRTHSRGETSGAVLDCMNYGLATIVNANGAMEELGGDGVWRLPDEFTDAQLIEALEALYQDTGMRRKLSARAREIILKEHAPELCARQYRDAIERFDLAITHKRHAFSSAVANVAPTFDDGAIASIALAHSQNLSPRFPARQLFVDISELVQRDERTGIQRVVRSVLHEWLANPPPGFRVEPVYATKDEGYRYARRYTLKSMNCSPDVLRDSPLDFRQGDIFLGLDLQPHVVTAHRAFFRRLRTRGVRVQFVIYDLLCILLPQYFVKNAAEDFTRWLEVVADTDGAICISNAVATEFKTWLHDKGPRRALPFSVDWFHLGADVENSVPTRGLPGKAGATLDILQARPSFLMVGTLEPRKKHVEVLSAFEQCWQNGLDINLVFVGKPGWLANELVSRLKSHAEFDRRLLWLEGISDEFLEKIYAASSCLIAASEGEGFGLPLIEAAQHRLPIIARDIPVFKEVAGHCAYYFSGDGAGALADAIKAWLALFSKGEHPRSEKMPWMTWKESVKRLTEILTGKEA